MERLIPNKKYENMVSQIIENFDFQKCRIVMTHLNWQWHGRGVPTIDDMKKMVRGHFIDVVEGILNKENNVRHYERYYVSSGGFTAWGYKNKYGSIDKLGLEFIVADWDVERE